ncbi:hypothetical protein AK812_SmicGene45749, partial [Symbiodinium microadriaticum]
MYVSALRFARVDAPTPRTLYLWCFSCSVAMRDLQKQE